MLGSDRLQTELQVGEVKGVLCTAVLVWLWLQGYFEAFLTQLYLLPRTDLYLKTCFSWKYLVLESAYWKYFQLCQSCCVTPSNAHESFPSFLLLGIHLHFPRRSLAPLPTDVLPALWLKCGKVLHSDSWVLETDFKACCLYPAHSPLSPWARTSEVFSCWIKTEQPFHT